jgi:molecular chaperone GrpE
MKKQQDKSVIDEKVKHPQNAPDVAVEEWKAKYVRVLADYQNLEKRTAERVTEVRQYAAESVLSRLLPVVDTFGMVTNHIKDPGLALAYKELLSVLTEQGVEKIEVLGREFDPMEMDCIEVVPGKDNEVVEEVQAGYRFRGKVLRVARVKVGKSEVTTH